MWILKIWKIIIGRNKMQLTGLNESIKDFAGKSIISGDSPATHKSILLQYLYTVTPKDGVQSAAIWSLGSRLHESEDTLEVDGAEYKLLVGMINKPKFALILHEPLRCWLESYKDKVS
jgi:hypothetical protein